MGIRGKTGEVVIGDKSGVWKTRAVKRRPIGEWWKSENAELDIGVPWNISADDDKADGEMMKIIRLSKDEFEKMHVKEAR